MPCCSDIRRIHLSDLMLIGEVSCPLGKLGRSLPVSIESVEVCSLHCRTAKLGPATVIQDFSIGGLRPQGQPSKNRYEHIHVRLAKAIHGLRHFWKAAPVAVIKPVS